MQAGATNAELHKEFTRLNTLATTAPTQGARDAAQRQASGIAGDLQQRVACGLR